MNNLPLMMLASVPVDDTGKYVVLLVLVICVLLPLLVVQYLLGKKSKRKIAPDQRTIGAFLFSKSKLVLVKNKEELALTPAEAQVLYLFCNAVNNTVSHAAILSVLSASNARAAKADVDALIAALRKKLSGDSALQIVEHPTTYQLTVQGA